MSLRIVPCTEREVKAFIREHHRHLKPPRGHKVFFAVADETRIVGVAVVGRPVAGALDDGWTAEVTRCCTDGTRNACSILYGAAWRAARAMGYRKLVTYTMPGEGGASLKAAGFKVVAEVTGRYWSCKSRPRVDTNPLQGKLRWERAA